MANGEKKRRRRRRRRRWVAAMSLAIVAAAWVASHRVDVLLGGGPTGDAFVRVVRADAPRGEPIFFHAFDDLDDVHLTLQSASGRLGVVRWQPDDLRQPKLFRQWPGVTLVRTDYESTDRRRRNRPIAGTATTVSIDYWLLSVPPTLACCILFVKSLLRPRPATCAKCETPLPDGVTHCPACGTAAAGRAKSEPPSALSR